MFAASHGDILVFVLRRHFCKRRSLHERRLPGDMFSMRRGDILLKGRGGGRGPGGGQGEGGKGGEWGTGVPAPGGENNWGGGTRVGIRGKGESPK